MATPADRFVAMYDMASFTPKARKYLSPKMRKAWATFRVVGTYRGMKPGHEVLVMNEAGETMAVLIANLQGRVSNPKVRKKKRSRRRARNPRIPVRPKTKAGYFLELVRQLEEWLSFGADKPGPVLHDYFLRTDLAQAVRSLPQPHGLGDREYIVVDFDVLPTIVEQAAVQGVSRDKVKQLVNRITTEIVPFLEGDPDDWWLDYILPILREKGFIDDATVQGARRAWDRKWKR